MRDITDMKKEQIVNIAIEVYKIPEIASSIPVYNREDSFASLVSLLHRNIEHNVNWDDLVRHALLEYELHFAVSKVDSRYDPPKMKFIH